MLLISYPSIESFTLTNFADNSINCAFDTGNDLKQFLHNNNINHQNIDEETLKHATNEFMKSLNLINGCNYDLDDLSHCNNDVFDFEENNKMINNVYKVMSLFVISLLDLGIIEVE